MSQTSQSTNQVSAAVPQSVPAVRIGVAAGVSGLLCCVGPTVLALLGIVSAGTAFVWANGLYDHYSWLFRLAGLAVLAGLVLWALRRRNECTLGGVRRSWSRLVLALGVAIGTYLVLYAVTTWLGTLA